ncbi:MAG: hypothetical protein ACXVBC_13770 [Bdellovibrionota bacterium]
MLVLAIGLGFTPSAFAVQNKLSEMSYGGSVLCSKDTEVKNLADAIQSLNQSKSDEAHSGR